MFCCGGEEGFADTDCEGGRAVEGSHRSTGGAGGWAEGAESHAAPHKQDHPES